MVQVVGEANKYIKEVACKNCDALLRYKIQIFILKQNTITQVTKKPLTLYVARGAHTKFM